MSLTTDGAIFAAQIQPAVQALDNARKDVMNTHKADHGRLRISAPTWFGQQALPPILSAFKERYPKISFEISLADGLVNIIDDDYDLAIRISAAPSDKFTIWRKISVVRRILVAAPGSRFCDMEHPNELIPDDCLAYSGESKRETRPCRTAAAVPRFLRAAHSAPIAGRSRKHGCRWKRSRHAAQVPCGRVSAHRTAGPRPQRLVAAGLVADPVLPPYQALPPRIASFSKFFEQQIPAFISAIE